MKINRQRSHRADDLSRVTFSYTHLKINGKNSKKNSKHARQPIYKIRYYSILYYKTWSAMSSIRISMSVERFSFPAEECITITTAPCSLKRKRIILHCNRQKSIELCQKDNYSTIQCLHTKDVTYVR